MKNILSGLTIAVIALSLSACTPPTADEVLPPNDLGFTHTQLDQVSTNSYFKNGEMPGGNTGVILDENNLVALLGGSSSCPPIIDKIVEAKDQVQIVLKPSPSEVCTMDFTIVGFQITSVSTNFSFYDKTISVCSDGRCTVMTTTKD